MRRARMISKAWGLTRFSKVYEVKVKGLQLHEYKFKDTLEPRDRIIKIYNVNVGAYYHETM